MLAEIRAGLVPPVGGRIVTVPDAYESARRGVLPPGITVRTWFDDDNAWAHGMAVYIPSVTNVASGIGNAIDRAKIIQGGNRSRAGGD